MAGLPYPFHAFAQDAAMLQIGDDSLGYRWMLLGGVEFDSGEQRRRVERDGATTPMEGDARPTGWEARFRFRLKDYEPGTYAMLHPGSASDGSSPNSATQPIDARVLFSAGDYLQDVRRIVLVSDPSTGTQRLDATVFPRALVEPYTEGGPDNDENSFQISLLAALPFGEDPNRCPFVKIENYSDATFDIADYYPSL